MTEATYNSDIVVRWLSRLQMWLEPSKIYLPCPWSWDLCRSFDIIPVPFLYKDICP